MNEAFIASLSRDVGRTLANTESLLENVQALTGIVAQHEQFISKSKQRWAWLSGVMAVFSLLGGYVGNYVSSSLLNPPHGR